jgi:phosphate acetyltransferase
MCSAVQAISSIEPAILPTSHEKIDASMLAFDESIDKDLLMKGFETVSTNAKLTPARFVHSMRQKCIKQAQRIVLPESNDHRILSAAAAAQRKGLAKIILLGEESLILQVSPLFVRLASSESVRCLV